MGGITPRADPEGGNPIMACRTEKTQRAYDLVNDRVLEDLGRLVLYTSDVPMHYDNWNVVDVKDIMHLPPPIRADRKLTDWERCGNIMRKCC